MKLTERSTFRIEAPPDAEPEVAGAVADATGLLERMGLLRSNASVPVPELTVVLARAPGFKSGYVCDVAPVAGRATVTAGTDEGLRCGLYAFLEFLGLRWFQPDAEPILPSLPLAPGSARFEEVPAFAYRGLHVCAGSHHHDPAVALWMSRLRMNRKLTHHGEVDVLGAELPARGLEADTTVHSYTHWIPDARYFDASPEWFSLIGGGRCPQRQGGQLCLSNADMRAAFVANMRAYVATHPHVAVLGICPNDGYGWCECEECAALDTPADRDGGTVNGRVADFVHDVCERLAASCPEVYLGHYSYSSFADFLDCRASWPRNLMISFTLSRCFRHAVDDPTCPRNRECWARLRRARDKVEHVYVYEYYIHNWGYLPAPVWNVVAADLAAYGRIGVEGFLSEVPGAANEAYSSFHLPLYVAARRLHDGNAAVPAILDDYCVARFGPAAAEAMGSYLHALEQGLDKMDGCFLHRPEEFARLFPAAVQEVARACLDRARAQAPSGSGAESEIRQESALFERWCMLFSARDRYRVSQPVPARPMAGLEVTAPLRKESALTLVDKISLVPPETNRTRVNVYGDVDAAGLLVCCAEEQMDAVAADRRDDLNGVCSGESIEIFLAAARDADTVYHVLVGAGGGHCASACTGRRWNWSWPGRYEVETARDAAGWRVLFRIPLAAVGAGGGTWYFTLIRNRHVHGWEISGTPEGGAYFDARRYIEVVC